MLDTNVLISALLFPGAKMDAMMNCIFTQHQLVLSSYVVEELKSVVRRKFPKKEQVIDKLLMMMCPACGEFRKKVIVQLKYGYGWMIYVIVV